jgi:hypothetical protein
MLPQDAEIAIVGTLDFCHTFPTPRGNQIERENIWHTIEASFETGKEIVLVKAIEGMGKTTLLAQFAKLHHDRCLSVFVQSGSRLGYDPDLLLMDLHCQANWLLSNKEIPILEDFDDGAFQKTLFALQKKARRQRLPFFFVIDGIDQIPVQSSVFRERILSVLPFGYPEFRFLLSGDVAHYLPVNSELSVETLPLSPFTIGETELYLGPKIDHDQLQEIYSVTKGRPSHLSVLYRLLLSGTPSEELIASLTGTLQMLFEFEWNKADFSPPKLSVILATLAYARHELTIAEVSTLVDESPTLVRTLLNSLSFIVVPHKDDYPLHFASESFKKYAASKLVDWKNSTEEQLITFLLSDPDSRAAISSLPDYLNQSGKQDLLLQYLSPEHFVRVMDHSQSLTLVKQRVKLGINAARSLGKQPDILRFAIQQSVLVDVDSVVASKSEVIARLALGDLDSALAQAQSALLKEDRLQLLSLIATKTREQGLSPDADLVIQIEQLFKEVEFAAIGDKALSVAADLMGIRPDLAISAIEILAESKKGSNADLAFARLSIRGALDRSADPNQKDVSERFRSNIKDSSVLRMSTVVALLVGSYNEDEIIAETEKLDNPIDRLYLLRQWLKRTGDSDKVATILEYALKLAIQTTEYTPTASHLREFATPLPIIKASERVTYLIGIFDAQKSTTARLGST